MSSSPAPPPPLSDSSSSSTPRTTATAGLTYVTTAARPAPTDAMSEYQRTNTIALQNTPRAATAASVPAPGISDGAVNAAGTASTTADTTNTHAVTPIAS